VVTRVYPPECMMKVWRLTFPTLNWDEIYFYDGMPNIYSFGDKAKAGFTAGSVFGTVRIYMQDGEFKDKFGNVIKYKYNPCDSGLTFKNLTHELVHAVQIKSQVAPQVFMWKWLTCYISDGIPNQFESCYEKEAQNFEFLIANKPNNRVQEIADWNPCKCSHSESPFSNKKWFGAELNTNVDKGFPAIDAAIKADTSGGHTFTKSSCSLGDCFGDNIFSYAKGIVSLVVSTIVTIAGAFFNEGPIAATTSIIGAAGGLIGGLSYGLGYGGLISGGLVSAIVGAVIGLIGGAFALGLLGAFADWIIGWLAGPIAGGSMNLVHSTDNGLTFKGKVTFERTRQQPALASSEDRLFLAWTGTDDQLNVFVSPNQTKTTFEKSGPCGPALSFNDQLFLAWKGKGNDHPNCMSSNDGVNFGSWFMSQGDGPAESTPGIAVGPSRIYFSWVGADNFIRLINLAPGNPINELPIKVHQLTFQTGHKCTPALAIGNGMLYLAWSTFWSPHFLNIARFPINPDGSLDFDRMSSNATNDFTKDSTGPALAFSSRDSRLYMAFTGADNGLWVISSPNDGNGWDKRCRLENELSREDAGPSITVHPSTGTVFLCWVGQDGD